MHCPTLSSLPPPPPGKTGWPWTEETPQLPDLMPDGSSWPKISIVTPIYNQEEFIEETIRSVLLQGYPNYEHVIINDGSTDGSLKVIEKYLPWVTCITQKNAGQSAALNHGFKVAAGELIGWQNSDDFYGPDNFHQGALMSRQFPEFEIYNGTARGFWEFNCQPPWLFEECNEFSRELFLKKMCVMNQSMFFRRVIFERGVFIKEDMHFGMDIEYFWNLSLEGFRYKLVPGMIGYYRQHKKAKSNSNVWRGDVELYKYYRKLCRDERLERSLRRKVRAGLRRNFLNSFRIARRTILKKLAWELVMPI